MRRSLLLLGALWVAVFRAWGQETPSQVSNVWTLERCLSAALQQSLSLEQSGIAVAGAQSDVQAAWGAFLPSVNANSGYFTNSGLVIDPVTNTVSRTGLSSGSGSLVASLNVFDGFQSYHQYRRAQVEEAVGKMRYRSGQYDVVLQVSSAYLQVLMAEEAWKVARDQEAQSLRLVERIQKMKAVGAGTQADVFQLQAQYSRDVQRTVAAQNQKDLTRLALFQAMNLPLDENAVLVAPEGATKSEGAAVVLSSPIASLVEASREHQPTIQVAQLQVKSAFHARKAAEAGFMPRLSLNGQWSTTYSNLDLITTGQQTVPLVVGYWVNPLDPTQRVDVYRDITLPTEIQTKAFGNQITDNVRQFVGLNMSVPLFNGFQVRNAVQRAKLAEQSAALNATIQEQQFRQTLERAQLDARAALSQFKAAEVAAQASKENLDYALVRREEGLLSAYDYSAAVNAHLAAVSEALRSKYDWFFKRKVLELYLMPADNLEALTK
jgi:outer membrane protein